MKICAIVLEYRGAAKTLACLASLNSQGLHTVIVVDNSDDIEASEHLAQKLDVLRQDGTDFTLQILRSATNLGFAGGVNLALQSAGASHCDAFFLINNDATAAPGAISLLAAQLEQGSADLVAPTVTDDTGEVQPPLYYQRYFGLLTAHPLRGSYPYLSGCCLMFKRDLLSAGRLLDEDFFMYGEDTMLGWRLAREKKIQQTVVAATVRHTGQGRQPACSLFYEYHMARAHLLLALKTWRTPSERPLLLAAKCLGLALRALRRAAAYRNAIPIRAFLLAWQPREIRKN